MTGKLYLGGGGNEKVAFEAEEAFFKDIDSVLYIPLAWPNDDFESCFDWFSNMCGLHKKLKIMMLKDPYQKINLLDFHAVYIGGGNTFKLLKKLKESKLSDNLIKFYKDGGKIFGGSAGALIWGKTIDTALICKDKDKNEVGLKDTKGFNQVADFDIQCHFEDNQIKEHQNYIEKTGRNIIGIPEETAVIIQDKNLKVIGKSPATLITARKIKKINPNSNLVLS